MINLLIVEDDATLSENIKEILADLGDITQVYDGEEGLFEAESGKKYPDTRIDLNCQG